MLVQTRPVQQTYDFLEPSKKIGNDDRDFQAVDPVLKMDSFGMFPAQESGAGGEVAEEVQQGSSDDGREEAMATGGEV